MFLIEGDGKAVLYTGDIRGMYKHVGNGDILAGGGC